MKIKKRTILITVSSFIAVLVLIYLGILLSLPPVKVTNETTAVEFFGIQDEEYLKIIDKIKEGEPLTVEEQRIREIHHIKRLEQFDQKAGAYAREMLEKGYLESSANQYLLQKQEEFSQWVTDEMRRFHEQKHLSNSVKRPTTPE